MVVTKIIVYKKGTIRVLGRGVGFTPDSIPERGVIKRLSSKSRQRMLFVMSETDTVFTSMLTLTYPGVYGLSGLIVKRHLAKALSYLRVLMGKSVRYFWFIEFQERGAPHFHILVNHSPTNKERALMAFRWSEILGGKDEDKVFYVHNRSEAWGRLRSVDGGKRYVSKYATKVKQKTVPSRFQNVGRFWGCSYGVIGSIKKEMVMSASEDEVREYLRLLNNPVADYKFLPSYVFHRANVSRETIGQDMDKT